jgi:peptidoglycan hydrolase-like protein with peptidoglycan-binding domain
MRKTVKIGTCALILMSLIMWNTGAWASLADDPLKIGSQSDLVIQVQGRLFELGYFNSSLYPTETDGYFDGGTYLAVKWFQRANGLHDDGDVGEMTYAALFAPDAISFASYQKNNPDFDWILERYCEGDEVVSLQMRLRDLGYFRYKVTGYFGPSTAGALRDFQHTNGLSDDGKLGAETREALYSPDAKRKVVIATPADDFLAVSRGGQTSMGRLVSWWEGGSTIFPRGAVAKVIDLYTGTIFYMKRTGGTNHADSEPVTAEDAAKIKSVWGGWSWARRPVIVEISGTRIAASMHGMPHAFDRVANNGMNGHVCIHFYKSRTHCGNAQCPIHQRCVMIAAGK